MSNAASGEADDETVGNQFYLFHDFNRRNVRRLWANELQRQQSCCDRIYLCFGGEVKRFNIQVNAVSPAAKTDMTTAIQRAEEECARKGEPFLTIGGLVRASRLQRG